MRHVYADCIIYSNPSGYSRLQSRFKKLLTFLGLQFLSVKVFIFLQVWTGILIRIVVNEDMIPEKEYYNLNQFKSFNQSFIVCVEMNFAAMLHLYAFNYQIFVQQDKTNLWSGFFDCFSFLDLYQDFLFVLHFLKSRSLGVSYSDSPRLSPNNESSRLLQWEATDEGAQIIEEPLD